MCSRLADDVWPLGLITNSRVEIVRKRKFQISEPNELHKVIVISHKCSLKDLKGGNLASLKLPY